MSARGIHVAVLVDSDVGTLWDLTQDPARHERWDLRFARIEPTGEGRFSYRRFGVRGTGTHSGERRGPAGATSALSFACSDRRSPIATGSGYWRYRPVVDATGRPGTVFETGYDYRPRYPRADRVFRPLMAWATAWSFDRLRLWADHGTTPAVSSLLAVLDVAARVALVGIAVVLGSGSGPVSGLVAGSLGLTIALVAPALPSRPSARRTTWSWHPATVRTEETVR